VKRSIRVMGWLALAGFGAAGCTTTYTEQDLVEQEIREDAAATSEEKRDREIGEQGGANIQAIDEEIQQVD
jgi:hypothetical protein